MLSSHSGHRELTPPGAPWRHSSVRVSCLSPAPSPLSLSLLVRGSPRTGPGEEKSGWLRVSEGRGTAAVIHITHSESWSCRGFTVRQTYVHIPALPLPGCLTSGKPLALSVPGFPHPQLPPRCREASEEEREVCGTVLAHHWHSARWPGGSSIHPGSKDTVGHFPPVTPKLGTPASVPLLARLTSRLPTFFRLHCLHLLVRKLSSQKPAPSQRDHPSPFFPHRTKWFRPPGD